MIRKVGTVTNSNGTHYVEHAVIKDPGENDITVMVRGLTLADNLTLQIKAVDLNGNESDWVNVNTQSN